MEDRELDVRIAEFMGWSPIPNEDGWQSPDGQDKHWPGPPNYSADIKAAMEVIEKMREREYFPRMWAAQVWNVEFWRDETFIANDADDSLSRAICLAVLSAITSDPPA